MYNVNNLRKKYHTLIIVFFTIILLISSGCTKEELKRFGKNVGADFIDSVTDNLRDGSSSSTNNKTETVVSDNEGPEIIITSHDTSRGIEIVSSEDSVTIDGKAVDNSKIVNLLINSQKADFDESGNFSHNVALLNGMNTITIFAIDTYGNTSVKEIPIDNRSDSSFAKSNGYSPLEPGTTPGTLPIWYEKQYAFVVGINRYKNTRIPSLRNAVNDAKEVSRMLKDMDFTVFEMYNEKANRENIIQKFKYLRNVAHVNDSFLFYFAGHGQGLKLQSGKEVGYIIPYDAAIDLTSQNVIDFDESAIALEYIKKILEDMKPKHISLLLDSCFSGLAMKRSLPHVSRMDHGYYQDILKRRAINILTAGDDQPVSDGTGHSPFTKAILMGIRDKGADIHDRDGYVTFGQLAVYVKDKVGKATDRRQRPQFDNFIDDDGEFIFKVR